MSNSIVVNFIDSKVDVVEQGFIVVDKDGNTYSVLWDKEINHYSIKENG